MAETWWSPSALAGSKSRSRRATEVMSGCTRRLQASRGLVVRPESLIGATGKVQWRAVREGLQTEAAAGAK